MNRGVFQSSPVQQVTAGGASPWWNLTNMRSQLSQDHTTPSSFSPLLQFPHPSTTPNLPMSPWQDHQELPDSWSQLLLGGFPGEEERCSSFSALLQPKKVDNWEEQQVMFQHPSGGGHVVDVKQESSDTSGYVYHGNQNCGAATDQEIHMSRAQWSQQVLPVVSSPRSCVTSFSSNMLDFSHTKVDPCRHPKPDLSPECNSTATGSGSKKARVQGSSSSSPQSTFKVRKEKLGDRITALHQLVSPFGKTDTASVLLEAIGYIRFLQNQIEALSSPYLGNAHSNARHSSSGQGERSCIFPEDQGQLLNDATMKRQGASDHDQKDKDNERKKDLRSRGLCLVPISCTMHVGSDNGADFWAPTIGGMLR